MSLHELVYVSLARHPMSGSDLCELLTQARGYNHAHGITGLLVYRNREFMQLIEGEQAEVASLFAKIGRDPRHQQVHRMWEAPIGARSCQDWAMGFAEPRDAIWHALPEGHRVLDDGLFRVGRSSAGQRLFMSLRDEVLRHSRPDQA